MLVPVTIDTALVPMNTGSIPAYFFVKFRTLLFGSALYCLVQNIIVSAQLPQHGIPETVSQMKKGYDSLLCLGRGHEQSGKAL